jgi:adenylyltransferase/sulfurtransferase
MFERYQRQIAFDALGEAGQRALQRGSALVVGCGGLGCAVVSGLARAGVGRVVVIDSDRVETSNLHRQILYDEEDLTRLKAEVAGEKLRRINSSVTIDSRSLRITAANVDELLAEVELVVDATDNMESRYLINEACVRRQRPWIYGGVTGAQGMLMNILPGQGPCFRCLFEPGPAIPAGPVFGPVPPVLGFMQAVEACKILAGADPLRQLLCFDLWRQQWDAIEVRRDPRCATCAAP